MTVYRGPNKGKLLAKVPDDRRRTLELLGAERALIYKTAVLTGLRLNELRTLTCRDLSFGDVPFVKLNHTNEKNRQGSTLAIRSDLATELREWIAGKDRGDRVFTVPAGLLRIMDRDLVAAGLPKKDADGCVVHVHALRHSFGTHLSLAGVAPRVAQAAMRHSNISLTMGAYTDARLLDTAEAIEGLPMFRTKRESENDPADQRPRDTLGTAADDRTSSDAPVDAPTTGRTGQLGSIPDHCGGLATDDTDAAGKQKPHKTLGFAGFSGMDDTELESVTSTMSTSERSNGNAANNDTKRTDAERLHQCLHQIAESGERSAASVLLDAIAETLGADAANCLIKAMHKRCTKESQQ